jgi:transcriptional regulator with XRE-family HTH domain
MAWEVPWLLRLGACLRALRMEAGLSQRALAARSGLAERSLRRIEHGHRRTRASTLQRLAEVLVRNDSARFGSADAVLVQLLAAAGPGLAEESDYRWRVDARRRRRAKKQRWRTLTEHTVERSPLLGGGLLEHHVHRHWVTRGEVREREYTVFRPR